MKVVIGHSDDIDSSDAVEEVIEKCREGLEGKIPGAAVLFADVEFDHKLILDRINEAFPGVALIGCTADGAFSSELGMEDNSLSLLCISSDKVSFSAGVGRNVSSNPGLAAAEAVKMAVEGLDAQPALCLSFFESLTTSGMEILSGLKNALGGEIPVFGGSAADQFKMEKTMQFSGSEVLSDSVPVLLMGGEIAFSYGVGSGRKPVGDKYKVTNVEGNRIYKIGDMTAVEFYEKHLGSLKDVTIEYPLAVFEGSNDSFYIRAPFKFNEDGSVNFFADIPDGAMVQMATGDRDDLMNGVEKAYREAMSAYPGDKPSFALVTSCAGRKAILGTRTKEECENLKALSGKGFPVMGYYSFGEVCPLQNSKNSSFHNETVVVLLAGDK